VNKIEVEEAQARDCASEFGSSGWTRAGLESAFAKATAGQASNPPVNRFMQM